jgi:hypothetical protein
MARGVYSLVDMQLFQEREGVIEGLEQILVVLDHLAAHVDAEPLLMNVVLISVECFPHWLIALPEKSGQKHRTLEAQRNRLKVWRANSRIAGQKNR